ncbi:MAG: 4'-phosphopantetheinyl transferase superfamily protein [Clostridia bacterium]|nr:4'-phosphopantetheinyl transferase superfamily protein [Clostridia bacterium]
MIRILCADISSADERIYENLYGKASPERKRRADRYLCREDKLRCVTADALLRIALKTDAFTVLKSDFGKPYIEDHEGFHYNLSHSGRYVVIAWGDAEVGVDVQQHYADTDMRMIAERCFSRDEQDYIRQSDQQILQRFYEVWTGKESYLKYIGEGLRKDLRSFSIRNLDPEIRCLYRVLGDEYSLSLCTKDKEFTFELSDVRQL